MNTYQCRGFLKRAPCSRATRIQWSIKPTGKENSLFRHESKRIFTYILRVLTFTSDRMDTRLQEMIRLLDHAPPWMNWSPHDDEFLGAGISSKSDPNNADEKNAQSDMNHEQLTKGLIQANGNFEILEENDLRAENENLNAIFLFWLQSKSSPHDSTAHIQDEYGEWLTDSEVRHRLQDGWIVHIPTRTVRRTRDCAAVSDVDALSEEPNSPPRHQIDPILMSPSRPRSRAVFERR